LRLKISKRKRDARDQKTSHRDLRHRIKNKSKTCRTFSEEGSCNKYGGEHSNQERLREVGGEFIYLRDKTCTVETLDVEEHFSKDRDVVKVKFIGKEGGSHIFKLVVTAAWQSNQMRSFHTIRGVDLEVESRIRRPSTLKGDSFCTGGNLSRDSRSLGKSGSMSGGSSGRPGKADEIDGRERNGWWNKHFVKQRDKKENWSLRVEGNPVKKEDQQPSAPSTTKEILTTGKAPQLFSNLLEPGHHGKSSNIPENLQRDAHSSHYFNLPDAVQSTVSDSSVESFLKGVRSQVEMKEEKVEIEEVVNVKKEKKDDEHKIEGVKAAGVLKV